MHHGMCCKIDPMTISEQSLTFWIKNGYNVLFKGRHGVGKTSIILDAFAKHNLRWQYFSAATMDPWVDFVGVPKERVTEDGKAYLDLVRPKHFQEDAVEAIFMDEFNRSSKKVRNAVMELIQFKSINGKKFNNLKIVWAAVNPDDDEDEEYDVEKLDPAQLDRFQVHVEVPYSPVATYFRSKYGEHLSHAAIEWWKELNKQEKSQVSPRRLDYALDIYTKHGDIRHVMPKSVSVSKLLQELKDGPFIDRMNEIVKSKDPVAAKKFINDENSLTATARAISKSDDAMGIFLPQLNRERLTALMVEHDPIADFIFARPTDNERLLKQLVSANNNKKLVARAQGSLNSASMRSASFKPKANATQRDFEQALGTIEHRFSFYNGGTADRRNAYDAFIEKMPDKLTEGTARRAVTLLDQIVVHSQMPTIHKHMPLLIALLNHLVGARPALAASISKAAMKRVTQMGLKVAVASGK